MRIKDLWTKLRALWAARTGRERGAMIVAGLIALAMLLDTAIYEPITLAFSEQEVRLNEAQNNFDRAADLINTYSKRRARLSAIEKAFKEVDLGDQALSHLEKLIQEDAGIPSGQFSIRRQGEAEPFGQSFTRENFKVHFRTAEVNKLSTFLNQLVAGPKPLLVTNLEIRKNSQRTLDVDFDATSISHKQ